MIDLQGTQPISISLGDVEVSEISLGGTIVWPVGMYYQLTLQSGQPVYSNTSTSSGSLYASASNSCTFKCYYDKYNSSNVRISRQEVYATPSSSKFIADGYSLKYDKDEYGTTQVSGGTKTATLTYNGISTTGDFSFYGNYSHKYYMNAVPDVSVFPASGGDCSVSDGYSYLHWDSGDNSDTTYLTWVDTSTMHPSGNPVIIIGNYHTLSVPSLGTHIAPETTYTLKVSGDNSAPYVTVTQAANTATHYDSSILYLYGTDEEIPQSGYYCSAAEQEIIVCFKTVGYSTYTSGATSDPSTNNFTNLDASTSYAPSGMIQSVGRYAIDGSSISIKVNANDSIYQRGPAVIILNQNGNFIAAAQIFQRGT